MNYFVKVHKKKNVTILKAAAPLSATDLSPRSLNFGRKLLSPRKVLIDQRQRGLLKAPNPSVAPSAPFTYYKFNQTFPRSSENVKYLLFFVCVSDLIQRNLLVYIQVDPGDNFHPDLSPFLGCRSHKIHLSHHYPLQVVVLSEMVPGIENLCFLQRFLSL